MDPFKLIAARWAEPPVHGAFHAPDVTPSGRMNSACLWSDVTLERLGCREITAKVKQ